MALTRKRAPAVDRRADKLNDFVLRVRHARDVLPPSEPGDNSDASLVRRLLDEALLELEK